MTDAWRGSIALPDGRTVDSILLASKDVASAPALPSQKLDFCCVVDTKRIPLYLAAGPSFHVITTSEDTEEWFYSILAKPTIKEGNRYDPFWGLSRAQAPVGILATVDELPGPEWFPRVTEVLFYATIATPLEWVLPTSSPTPTLDGRQSWEGQIPAINVHMLPLSSDLLLQSQIPECYPVPRDIDTPPPMKFLPSRFPGKATEHQSPKRKRDVFQAAEEARKQAKRKGGESIAAAAAKLVDNTKPIPHPRKSLSIDIKSLPSPDLRRPNTADSSARPFFGAESRSPTFSHDLRPVSRKDALDGAAKRSSLSHVANVTAEPAEPTTETRNKEALSRVVMAAMRMHGLERKKSNPSRAISDSDPKVTEEVGTKEAAKDEEFKLIYHQTYKGAALALRNHIKTAPLHASADRMHDVVEKLLDIFCNDPLTGTQVTDEPTTFLSTPSVAKSEAFQKSPFDLPSSTARVAKHMQPMHSPTPKTKHT